MDVDRVFLLLETSDGGVDYFWSEFVRGHQDQYAILNGISIETAQAETSLCDWFILKTAANISTFCPLHFWMTPLATSGTPPPLLTINPLVAGSGQNPAIVACPKAHFQKRASSR